MEADARPPLDRPPSRLLRRDLTDQNELRILPDELRLDRARSPLPEPAVASDLAHRLRDRHGRLAVLLLPPRRAARGPPPYGRRPRGPRDPIGRHSRPAAVDRRDGERTAGGVGRARGRDRPRGVQEDRRLVLRRRRPRSSSFFFAIGGGMIWKFDHLF